MSRRGLLRGFGGVAGVALAGGIGIGAGLDASPAEAGALISRSIRTRKIDLFETHTAERLSITYYNKGKYMPGALARLNRALRDWRTGDVIEMDPRVIDIVHDVRAVLGVRGRIEIISGYRSPATNAMLAARSNGVASRSLHLVGQAIDFRIAGVPLDRVHKAAMSLRRGGVGLYTGSNFVHVDTGKVRSWGS